MEYISRIVDDVIDRKTEAFNAVSIADSIPLMRFRTRRREVRFWIWIF